MKFFFAFVLTFFIISVEVDAAGLPYSYSYDGEAIFLVTDLPNTDEWSIEGKYVDLGIIYKQFKILFIPIWNYDKRWCLFQGETYWTFSKEDYAEMGIIIPDSMSLPFTRKWGGFLVGIILIIVIYFKIKKIIRNKRGNV
ncbi:MAG: hypothetical protein Ta2B_09660 [Termitinemataceae bacterium]|nr:MAG: hypothetical protein Ta2B_09660 [Termitinemataceae bacterium]